MVHNFEARTPIWRMSALYGPEIVVNNRLPLCCPLIFSFFPPTSYPLISLLSPACLCSFVLHFLLDLRSPPLFASSANSSVLLFFFSVLFTAIRPRRRAGTIQRWQNCTKHWVSKETIKAPSESCSFARDPHWAAAAWHLFFEGPVTQLIKGPVFQTPSGLHHCCH